MGKGSHSGHPALIQVEKKGAGERIPFFLSFPKVCSVVERIGTEVLYFFPFFKKPFLS